MEVNFGVNTAQADEGTVPLEALTQLAEENLRLRRLVGELLLKNQRLREDATPVHTL